MGNSKKTVGNSEKTLVKAFTIVFIILYVVLLVSFIVYELGVKEDWFIYLFIVIFITIVAAILYQACRILLKRPNLFSTSRAASNTMLTCKHGHNVPVWVNRGKKHMWGMYGTNGAFCRVIVDGSTMPEVCPICGAHWHTPDKKR